MPFRERCSHPPLPYRDLGKRRRTRTCLWALALISPTNALRHFHPKAAGTRGQEHRGRITSPLSMAAVTTLMIRRKHHTHFRMTRSLLECKSLLTWFHHWIPDPCLREGLQVERESLANCFTTGTCWIMRFYGPSQELQPWTSECLLQKCSSWDVGYVGFSSVFFLSKYFCGFEVLDGDRSDPRDHR